MTSPAPRGPAHPGQPSEPRTQASPSGLHSHLTRHSRDGARQVISGPNDPKFVLRAALKGFDAANTRFNGLSAHGAGPEDVFIPLSEALWWAVTVDDGFESLAACGNGYRPSLGDYQFARENNPNGRFLKALRYARDRCGHQRALATGARLPASPLSVPFSLGPVICWRPSADFPAPDRRFVDSKLQGEYDRLLSGRPVAEALRSAGRWFAQERAQAGL